MKKFFALLLSLAFLFGLVACAQSGSDAAGETTASGSEFLVGYSKVNITPEYSVPLRGYGNPTERMSTGYLDYLYATCAAITDTEGNTVVVFGIDLINAFDNCFPGYRQKIAEKLGIPVDNVHMSCSHMHAGCDMSLGLPSTVKYIKDCEKWFLQAAEEAMADRKPVSGMQYASTETEGLNFIRRYLRTDGTPAGHNFEKFSDDPITRYESEIDSQLQLIKFVREGANDVIMANFQTHPHRASSKETKEMTADIVGVFRNELENTLGADVLYFTGSSGNVDPKSTISADNITADYKEQGKALAQYAINMEGKYTDVELGTIRTISTEHTVLMDHSRDHLVDEATQVITWLEGGKTVDECRAYMKEHWITSLASAKRIVTKATAGTSFSTGLWAFAIGEIGFAVVPFEMFVDTGVFIKQNSPFTATFVLTCANTSHSYLPTELAHQNGGYEVDTTKCAPGEAEKIADAYVSLLNQLK